MTDAPMPAEIAAAPVGERREPYVVLCGVPPGDRVDERGVYVDQLYF